MVGIAFGAVYLSGFDFGVDRREIFQGNQRCFQGGIGQHASFSEKIDSKIV